MKIRSQARAGTCALALALLVATPAMAATNSVTLSNGAQLAVGVQAPSGTGGTFLIPAGQTGVDVPVTGTASIGQGEPNVHWTYVVDVSTSTGLGCGLPGGTVLDCEKEAVTNLNNAVTADGSAVDVGLSVFAGAGATADMKPDAGQQPLTTPGGAGPVIASVHELGVSQYTAYSVPDLTNFGAGLQSALVSVTASGAASKNVVFLSDGASNTGSGFPAAVQALADQGATIYSFAVGSGSSCTAGANGTLEAMASATGGSCTAVPNPADLPDIVKNVTGTQLTALTLDGATLDSTSKPLPLTGPDDLTFTGTTADAAAGAHEVCATATGTGPSSDPASEQSVKACETFYVFGFSLAPETATNELGKDQSHSVTATVTGEPGHLAGWPVAFVVTGQNAGATGTCSPADCATDADGHVTFTYSVPLASASLGTDTISATVTIDDQQGTLSVAKTWQDTTPPVATCVPGPNPDGVIPAAPGTNGKAQNPDGYYTIAATDDVWGVSTLRVYLADNGSSKVFGPFGSPTNIKYVQATGATPSQQPGSGYVKWNLKGKGDALVHATDGSGNSSAVVSCLVPQPPR